MAAERWAEVDRLFHAALDRTPDERAAYLDEACAGDLILRNDVESLLDHESAASEFLEHPALQQEAALLAGEIPAVRDPQIPGFTILGALGEGGMGIVYLAQQNAPIHRRVALKLIKEGMDTRRVIARFDAEREALARMQHPHIAAVYDAGTTTDGRPYFVMEYVEGEPVTEYCDRHRLSTQSRLELFVDVCGAVQHAHQKGVIHRDLKPSNVLVADDEGRPQAKIIDFGVAKATDPSMAGGTAFTEAGTIVGTPEYMSPEQAALSEDIDTATDVYSLGAVLYELLVGALPFDPAMLRAAGFDEMRRIIRESDPPRPSSRLTGARAAASAATRQTDVGRLTRQLKGDLDWITLKALEKDRRLRYATVAAFASDIGHYLADEPIAARAPSAAYRVRKFVRRYRGAVAAASAVLIVLVAGLVASLTQYARAESQRVEIESGAYVLSLGAAAGDLQFGLAAAAQARLLAVPVQHRGWEWQHLLLFTDSSVDTFERGTPCAPRSFGPTVPSSISDNVLTIDAGRDRVYFRRCETLQVFDGAGSKLSSFTLPGRIIAVGPRGESLVVSRSGTGESAGFVLQVVESATARVLKEFAPITAEPLCGAFNRNGTRVAVGATTKFSASEEPVADVFDVWDVTSGSHLRQFSPPATDAYDTRPKANLSCMVAFSPHSIWLASSGGTVRVWRVDSKAQAPVAAGDGQAGNVSQPIAWNADGSRLAIGRASGLVDVIEFVDPDSKLPRVSSKFVLKHFDGNGLVRERPMPQGDLRSVVLARAAEEVRAVTFSGDAIVTGTDRTVGVWSVEERTLKTQLSGHRAQIVGVAIGSGGRAWTADGEGQIKVWPSAGQGAVAVLPGAPAATYAVSANGAVLVTAESDGGVYAWRLADLHRGILRGGTGVLDRRRQPLLDERPGNEILTAGIAISADSRLVLVSALDAVGTVRSFQVGSGLQEDQALNATPSPGCASRLQQPPGGPLPQGPVHYMAIGPDGRSLAFKQGTCLVVRDMETLRNVAELPQFEGGSSTGPAFAFRPDGLLVVLDSNPAVSGPGPARIQIWDWRKKRIVAETPTPSFATAAERRAAHLVISPGGGCVATIGATPAIVSIWGVDLRRELGRIPVPPDTRDVALSADCTRLASFSSDTTIRIWDVNRREQLLVLVDDDQHENGLAFTPDGRLIARRASGGYTIWESVRRQ